MARGTCELDEDGKEAHAHEVIQARVVAHLRAGEHEHKLPRDHAEEDRQHAQHALAAGLARQRQHEDAHEHEENDAEHDAGGPEEALAHERDRDGQAAVGLVKGRVVVLDHICRNSSDVPPADGVRPVHAVAQHAVDERGRREEDELRAWPVRALKEDLDRLSVEGDLVQFDLGGELRFWRRRLIDWRRWGR